MSTLQHNQNPVPELSNENDVLSDDASDPSAQCTIRKRLRQSSSDNDQSLNRKLPKLATREHNEKPPPRPISSSIDASYVSLAKTKTKTFRISSIPDSLTYDEIKT